MLKRVPGILSVLFEGDQRKGNTHFEPAFCPATNPPKAPPSIAPAKKTRPIITTITQNGTPQNLVFLITALMLIPAFAWWMQYRVKHGRPALIPNSVWQSRSFTAICLCVFFMWGAFNGVEQVFTLYLQYCQKVQTMPTTLA